MDLLPFIRGSRSALAKLNELLNFYNCFKNLRGDGLIKVNKAAGGVTLSLDIDQTRARIVKSSGIGGIVSDLYIVKVLSDAGADGIYNCYKQAGWGLFEPPSIEVLNLYENDPLEDYTPGLAKDDLMAACQMPDEEDTMRWVGFPLVPSVRLARTTEAAGASKQITCNLLKNDGETKITEGLGAGIEVYCKITRDINFDEYNLNEASPRLSSGEDIQVVNRQGKWWAVQTFQVSENRECQ